MNKQKILFVLLALLGLIIAAVLALSRDGKESSPTPKIPAPVKVSRAEALDWGATRMPQFFWITPRKGEELRLDPADDPAGRPAVAYGILDRRAQRKAARQPLIFTYLIQSFLERPARIAELRKKASRSALFVRRTPRWTAYVLPAGKKGERVTTINLFSADAPVVGALINASRDQSLRAAKRLIERVNLVYPPNG